MIKDSMQLSFWDKASLGELVSMQCKNIMRLHIVLDVGYCYILIFVCQSVCSVWGWHTVAYYLPFISNLLLFTFFFLLRMFRNKNCDAWELNFVGSFWLEFQSLVCSQWTQFSCRVIPSLVPHSASDKCLHAHTNTLLLCLQPAILQ